MTRHSAVVIVFASSLLGAAACTRVDPVPAQLAAHHPKVKEAVEDVYIWGGLYSLDTTPEERVIDAVTAKIRERAATAEDIQAAYDAQVAKRKYLERLFEKQQVLRTVANEQSKLAQAIRDPEIRRAAIAVAGNTQKYLSASDRWRKLQTQKAEWTEQLFVALRDETEPPNSTGVKQLNDDLRNTVQEIERLRSKNDVAFAEFQGVVARKATT